MKIKGRRLPLIVGVFWCALLSGCAPPEFVDADGKNFEWQDYHGQWLVVNYWAEWCAPCREEIPHLNQFDQQIGQSVLGVNFDRPDAAELQRQIETLDVQFRVVASEAGRRLAELTPQVLPTSYVFDQRGQLLKKLVGPQTGETIRTAMGN